MEARVHEQILPATMLLVDGDLILGVEHLRVEGDLNAPAEVDHGQQNGLGLRRRRVAPLVLVEGAEPPLTARCLLPRILLAPPGLGENAAVPVIVLALVHQLHVAVLEARRATRRSLRVRIGAGLGVGPIRPQQGQLV